jgi:hypothetical protein
MKRRKNSKFAATVSVIGRANIGWCSTRDGSARVLARCDCMVLPVSRDQSEELHEAALTWEEAYWRPLLAHVAAERRVAEINREFAGHFARHRRWKSLVDTVRSLLGLDRRRAPPRIGPTLLEHADLRPRRLDAGTEGQLKDLLSAEGPRSVATQTTTHSGGRHAV